MVGRFSRPLLINRWIVFFFCLVIQLGTWQGAYGGESQQAIKAAYLYNFAKFTHWGDLSETAPLHIQIVGTHPFGFSLVPLTSKFVAKHPVVIDILTECDPEQSLHILFISRSQARELRSILNSVADKKVLTVSDIPDFVERGGMIGLIEKGNNIRFRINLDAAHSVGLILSSQMLRLADSVINSSGPR